MQDTQLSLPDHIRAWLNYPTGATRRNGEPQTNRHVLNISEIEVQARMPHLTLTKWLGGHKSLPPVHIHNLIDVLELHGYRAPNNDHNFI